MKKFLGIFLFIVGFYGMDVVAGERYLFSPIASYHEDREDGECEFNPGLGYREFVSEYMFRYVGAFRNSHCNIAVQGLIGWETDRDRGMGVGFMGGLSSGYPSVVIGVPYIRVGSRVDKWNLNVMVLPIPGSSVYGIGVSYRM